MSDSVKKNVKYNRTGNYIVRQGGNGRMPGAK